MSDHTKELAERIHAEADIASRAGQSDRLRVIAAEVRALEDDPAHALMYRALIERAEKAERRNEKLELERAGWARRIDRAQALADEWVSSGASLEADMLRAALADDPERPDARGA